MDTASTNALEMFCHNLTSLASQWTQPLQPAYVREIACAFEMLAQRHIPTERNRTRANPVFLDTDGQERWLALREALAALCYKETPSVLHEHSILMLDYEAIMAGVDTQALVERAREIDAKYPCISAPDNMASVPDFIASHAQESSQWQQDNLLYQRLSRVFAALRVANTPTILFIDHLHRLLGGDWEHYPFDMFNMLHPALYRQEIQIWGACTLAEYQMLERDPSLQRLFSVIYLPSASAYLAAMG